MIHNIYCYFKEDLLLKTHVHGVGGERAGSGGKGHMWLIHADVWQNQHNIVKQLFSNKNIHRYTHNFNLKFPRLTGFTDISPLIFYGDLG